jgi:hypothetical protein
MFSWSALFQLTACSVNSSLLPLIITWIFMYSVMALFARSRRSSYLKLFFSFLFYFCLMRSMLFCQCSVYTLTVYILIYVDLRYTENNISNGFCFVRNRTEPFSCHFSILCRWSSLCAIIYSFMINAFSPIVLLTVYIRHICRNAFVLPSCHLMTCSVTFSMLKYFKCVLIVSCKSLTYYHG